MLAKFKSFYITDYETPERVSIEFLNYQIKVIIEKYTYSCFTTHIGTKNSSVAPFCRPYVVSIVSRVNFL